MGARLLLAQGFAPRAGAGTTFHERVKGCKGPSRGEYRFSPLVPLSTTKGSAFGIRLSSSSASAFRTGTSLCVQIASKVLSFRL
ncbi:hypothetical protein [Clostridium merdae]|uniref:hypothetical protein n=1 Tax=Clostridium merdae TaxID=1958780 RepID=UPI00117DD5C2|nr:hypothetical protein [Clostridium merdae]